MPTTATYTTARAIATVRKKRRSSELIRTISRHRLRIPEGSSEAIGLFGFASRRSLRTSLVTPELAAQFGGLAFPTIPAPVRDASRGHEDQGPYNNPGEQDSLRVP